MKPQPGKKKSYPPVIALPGRAGVAAPVDNLGDGNCLPETIAILCVHDASGDVLRADEVVAGGMCVRDYFGLLVALGWRREALAAVEGVASLSYHLADANMTECEFYAASSQYGTWWELFHVNCMSMALQRRFVICELVGGQLEVMHSFGDHFPGPALWALYDEERKHFVALVRNNCDLPKKDGSSTCAVEALAAAVCASVAAVAAAKAATASEAAGFAVVKSPKRARQEAASKAASQLETQRLCRIAVDAAAVWGFCAGGAQSESASGGSRSASPLFADVAAPVAAQASSVASAHSASAEVDVAGAAPLIKMAAAAASANLAVANASAAAFATVKAPAASPAAPSAPTQPQPRAASAAVTAEGAVASVAAGVAAASAATASSAPADIDPVIVEKAALADSAAGAVLVASSADEGVAAPRAAAAASDAPASAATALGASAFVAAGAAVASLVGAAPAVAEARAAPPADDAAAAVAVQAVSADAAACTVSTVASEGAAEGVAPDRAMGADTRAAEEKAARAAKSRARQARNKASRAVNAVAAHRAGVAAAAAADAAREAALVDAAAALVACGATAAADVGEMHKLLCLIYKLVGDASSAPPLGAPPADVAAAFKRALHTFHPDKHVGAGLAHHARAEEVFKVLQTCRFAEEARERGWGPDAVAATAAADSAAKEEAAAEAAEAAERAAAAAAAERAAAAAAALALKKKLREEASMRLAGLTDWQRALVAGSVHSWRRARGCVLVSLRRRFGRRIWRVRCCASATSAAICGRVTESIKSCCISRAARRPPVWLCSARWTPPARSLTRRRGVAAPLSHAPRRRRRLPRPLLSSPLRWSGSGSSGKRAVSRL